MLDIADHKKNAESYWTLKERVEANPELISSVDEVIQLDVTRSEDQMPGVAPKVLLSVLRAYALYDPDI